MSELPATERAGLRDFLMQRFSLAELKDLSFDLSVDYEMFGHGTKPEFCRNLITHFERRQNLGCLIQRVVELRPDEMITRLLAFVGSCQARAKVQLVIAQERLASKPELLNQLAALLGVSPEEVSLIATAAGSLRLLVGVPEAAAEKLLALPLPYRLGDQYDIIDVRPYPFLDAATQTAWRAAAQRGLTAGGRSCLFLGLLGLAGAVAATVVIIAALGVLAVSAAPDLTVENHCDSDIDATYALPLIGEVGVFVASDGQENFRFPPGTYRFFYDGQSIRAEVPIVGQVGPFNATRRFSATFDGVPIEPSERPLERAIGWGAEHTLALCAGDGR